eukprot:355603-Chlamydomonas_euryale.AAC.3
MYVCGCMVYGRHMRVPGCPKSNQRHVLLLKVSWSFKCLGPEGVVLLKLGSLHRSYAPYICLDFDYDLRTAVRHARHQQRARARL